MRIALTMKRLPVLLLLATLSTICISLSAQISEEKAAQINRLFSPWNYPVSPGAAVGIIQDGKLVFKKGYGMADLEHNIPISPHSAFYIGSVSKQFVTMCILLLEEEGKLTLDDEIQTYLPDFPTYNAPLTIRNFIHHTSGVRDNLTLWELTGKDYYDHIDKNQIYELIKRQKSLNFTPGEKFLYSNSCYFMLGMIVEKASGMSLRDFAEQHIFDPLEMNRTHFHDDHRHLIPNRAFSYDPAGDGQWFDNLILRYDLVGSGGIYSTIEDLAKWDANFYDNRLGKGNPWLIEHMHEEGRLNHGESCGYAYALINGTYRGLKTVSHGGALAGYRAELMRFPDQAFSVVILANVSDFTPTEMAYKVADIMLAEAFEEEEPIASTAPRDESSQETEEEITQSRNIASVPMIRFDDYVGSYYSEELDVAYVISLDQNQLMLKIGNNELGQVNVDGRDKLSTQYLKLSFERKNDKISGFTLDAERVTNLTFKKEN